MSDLAIGMKVLIYSFDKMRAMQAEVFGVQGKIVEVTAVYPASIEVKHYDERFPEPYRWTKTGVPIDDVYTPANLFAAAPSATDGSIDEH